VPTSLGYNIGTPDGNFGAGTKAAVIQYQTDKKITPADGVVNQATWAALLATQ
jgi:peptidoglycan hydrolase-like protein with peptidoglycan-binding domain